MLETISTQLYLWSQWANQLVTAQLSHLTIVSIGIIFVAGLLTSMTPCMLSMLPITVGYLGAYDDDQTRMQGALQSLWFALGLATTLAGLGIAASSLGKVYGQIGIGLPIFVSVVAIVMGLNQLELIKLRLPNVGGMDWISESLPKGVRTYLIGLTFGLVASPCSTPVLATLLAWLANTQDPVLGALLLLAYAAGYVFPLVIAGTFTVAIKQILELRQWSAWITPASGVLLLGFGVFSLVSRLPFLS
ncbi:sulfite exporter TauE/SafE family protein [filamentous cyanobacterium LEGE 11480]|uniref:Sulfite exporter TauE/SafE family protein n=1 Tax=Romeriopsis navalis LEGE 11480 TaxID=2777977 RepID=A0A928Z0Q6_9CYAN|nr:cytochrome c biogenesis protein CcdA [Romeriopsis navalis]MBE9028516.1 sulfite exporter TauE/SafE family protein [Romeriopsis navalis LEGE 11480]